MDNHPELPILHLTYEDTIKDPVGQVEKLNAFLGTDRDRQLCQAIAETCRFSNMQNTRKISQEALKSAHWEG
nr:hypothetical protein BaRGS_020109 [Batillaria attramentaria]